MGFWLEQENGNSIAPVALAHHLHPIKKGRGMSAEITGFDDVFPTDDFDSSLYTQFIMIYIPCIIAAL